VLRPAAEPLIQPGRPYARRAVGERHEPRRAARPLKLTHYRSARPLDMARRGPTS
jgi:hypothetical protein